jgi:two-component system cell cycle response regulator
MITETFKVLLLEDDTISAKITTRMLVRKGEGRFPVTRRARLDETLQALREDDYDIILSDLNVPDSEGLKTLAAIAAVAPDVPIVALTATDGDEIGIRAVQLGAQDFLVKGDFNEAALLRSLLHSIERHRMQRIIRQLAIIDELTTLYNRRGFNSLNQDMLARGLETEDQGYICYFDLDRFKQINDELGHQMGDEALTEFAAALRNAFRKDTLIARLGGDEFVAMGVELRPGQVEETVNELVARLAERNARPEARFAIETSAGFTRFGRGETRTLEELLAAADGALYANKEQRKQSRLAVPPVNVNS